MDNGMAKSGLESELLARLEVSPDNLEDYNKLFELYTSSGRYVEAVACFKKIAELYSEFPVSEYIRLCRYFYSKNYMDGVVAVASFAKEKFPGNISLYNELLIFYKSINNSEQLHLCYSELLNTINNINMDEIDLSFSQILENGYVMLAGRDSFSDILLTVLRINRPDINYVGKIDFAPEAVDIPGSNIYAFSGLEKFSANIHGVIICGIDTEEVRKFLIDLYRYREEHAADYVVVLGPTLDSFLEELGIKRNAKYMKLYKKCGMSLIYGFFHPQKNIKKLSDLNLDTELLNQVACIEPGEFEPPVSASLFPYIPPQNRKDVKIVSMFHKPYVFFDTDIHLQLHCGRKIAEMNSKDGTLSKVERDWMQRYTIGDDTGENISHLNRHFCEMSGIYWLWKNYDKIGSPDYLCIQHYRRWFYCTCKPWFFDALDKYDMILPNRGNSWVSSEKVFEKGREYYYDYEFIKENSPEYLESFRYYMNNSGFYAGNMFICRKELFFEYCEFIFPVLFYIEENTDYALKEKEIIAQGGDQVQARIMNMYRKVGYHAEHLTTAFIFYQLQKGLKTLEQHIMSLP